MFGRRPVGGGLPLLAVTGAATALADALVPGGAVPAVTSRDALHVAIAESNGIDYLLTWNFRHIANATLRARINEACESQGYEPPVIYTPDEVLP